MQFDKKNIKGYYKKDTGIYKCRRKDEISTKRVLTS
jgi:hypothetical protein